MLKILKNANLYINGDFLKKDIAFNEKIVEIGDNLKGDVEINFSENISHLVLLIYISTAEVELMR